MKVVFLDRDGTLIVDPPDERVDSISKIKLFPDTLEALGILASAGFSAVLITNQTGIAEGRITPEDFEVINDKIIEMLEPSGIKILKTYMCPHKPEDNCICRKPKPAMIVWGAKDFEVDLAQSYMIGDRPSDVMAGLNAETKAILVKTANVPATSDEADYTAENLLDAARYVVSH